MASYFFDKHFKGEEWVDCRGKVDKTVTVRLSAEQLSELGEMYPGKSISFGIRTCIHDTYVRQKNPD